MGAKAMRMSPPGYGVSWVDDQPLQAKLAVGSVGDRYEREADRMADLAMSRLPSREGRLPVQAAPQGGRFSSTGTLSVHRSGHDQAAGLSRDAESKVRGVLRRGGARLPSAVRVQMESGFGVDFGHVRVHTDDSAIESSRALQARAYTVGNHIVFDQGQYQPGTQRGMRLLAHELAHVVQQRGAGVDMVQRWGWINDLYQEARNAPVLGDAIRGAEALATSIGDLWEKTKQLLLQGFQIVRDRINSVKGAIVGALEETFKWVEGAVEWIKDKAKWLAMLAKLVSDLIDAVSKLKDAMMVIFKAPLELGRGYAVALGMDITIMSIKVGFLAKEDFQRTPDDRIKLTKVVKSSIGAEVGVGTKLGPAVAEASAGVRLDGIFKEVFLFDDDKPPIAPLIIAILPISSTPLGVLVRSVLPAAINPGKYATESAFDLEAHAYASAEAKISAGESDDKKSGASSTAGSGKEEKNFITQLLEGFGISGEVDVYAGVGVAMVEEGDDDSAKEKLLRFTVKLGGEVKVDVVASILGKFGVSVPELIQRYFDVPELRISGELSVAIYLGVSADELFSKKSAEKLVKDPIEWIKGLVTSSFKKLELQGSSKPSDDAATTLGEGADLKAVYEFDGKNDPAPFIPDELVIARRVEPENEDAVGDLVRNKKFMEAMEAIGKIPAFSHSETLLVVEMKIKKPLLVSMFLAAEAQSDKEQKTIWRKIFDFLVKSEPPEEFSFETLLKEMEKPEGKENIEVEEAYLRVLAGVTAGAEFEAGAGVKKGVEVQGTFSMYQDTNLLGKVKKKDIVRNLEKLLTQGADEKAMSGIRSKQQAWLILPTVIRVGDAGVTIPPGYTGNEPVIPNCRYIGYQYGGEKYGIPGVGVLFNFVRDRSYSQRVGRRFVVTGRAAEVGSPKNTDNTKVYGDRVSHTDIEDNVAQVTIEWRFWREEDFLTPPAGGVHFSGVEYVGYAMALTLYNYSRSGWKPMPPAFFQRDPERDEPARLAYVAESKALWVQGDRSHSKRPVFKAQLVRVKPPGRKIYLPEISAERVAQMEVNETLVQREDGSKYLIKGIKKKALYGSQVSNSRIRETIT